MLRKLLIVLAFCAGASRTSLAGAQTPTVPTKSSDTTTMSDSMPGMDMSQPHTVPKMKPRPDSTRAMPAMPGTGAMSADEMMIGTIGISMDRMGSGTTWIPDAVSLPSRRRMVGSWMLMGHGFVFAQYDRQFGPRGGGQAGSLNWAMLMATHDLAGGRFQARTMLSLDALGVTARGYPLLLQSGEMFNGTTIHDRQHPHDFWMELGALYQRGITKRLAWSVYAAPSGEPALGPVAFMHRPSAMDNSAAPISHHWQDATHISFGVLTVGLFTHSAQLEVSAFNGREPDQNRWNFDPIRLDSYSTRITLNPDSSWSGTLGYGYLRSPEAAHPDESVHRITASVIHGKRIGANGEWSSAFIVGANKRSSVSNFSKSALLESEAIFGESNTIFARLEQVQKSAEDLDLDVGPLGGGPSGASRFSESLTFNVASVQLGYIRELLHTHLATLGLGAAGTLNFVPSALEPLYGSANPAGAIFFVRLRPFRTGSAPADAMRM